MNTPQFDRGLVWVRRDLRADDHAALYHALKHCKAVHVAFVFDRDILDALPRADRRVEFIHAAALALDSDLRAISGDAGVRLITRHGSAAHEVVALAKGLGVQAVFCNRDVEPDAIARDLKVRGALANAGIAFHQFKDHVVFDADEVLTQLGQPYSVFTPYKRAWLAKVDAFYLRSYPVVRHAHNLAATPSAFGQPVPTSAELGFVPTNLSQLRILLGRSGALRTLDDFLTRIDRYHEARNYPAIKGPSYLSVHLRFGTLSIRELARVAHERAGQGSEGAATWLSELIWRDFYMQVLAHHPHVVTRSFKPAFDRIRWHKGKDADRLFSAWCEGQTGYPLVDAAMRQLRRSGYMHNRLRMVTASFLCKDLGLDWRRGEAWFAEHLNDFDLAANNGGWQWAASTGTDAQPWFRIFNPVTQSEKFDPQGQFIRKYVPELAALSDKDIHAPWQHDATVLAEAGVVLGQTYPHPIVDHAQARADTLARYGRVTESGTHKDAPR